MWLSRWLFDGSLAKAAMIAVMLLIVLGGIFFIIRNTLSKSPELFLTSALLLTLLVSPYLYNYDFLLLVVPFAVLINKSNLMQKIIVIVCYPVPTFALVLLGRAGNISLMIVTIVIAFLLYLRAKDGIDVPALAS